MSPRSIVLAIVLAIVALAAVAYWDEEREAGAALDDLGQERAVVARAVGAALEARASVQLAPVRLDLLALRAAFAPVAEPESLALLEEPGAADFLASAGPRVRLPEVDSLPDRDACGLDGATDASCWFRVPRVEAAALGLPARTALAGVAFFADRGGARWGVAVVATARRERDRQQRAVWRLALGFAMTGGLVLGFGTLALRKQRRELALARELAVRQIIHERDERLVRADKLATMGALAIGIAHEVSTPLGVIAGRAEQLAPRVAEDPRAARAVAAISEQAVRIGKVVRSMLTLARGGAPPLERVEPARLAQTALELVAHRFEAAGVTVSFASADGLPEIACDPGLLEQALVNLLLNACDACDRGGHVAVKVEPAGDRIAFVVADDGAGIGAQAALRATEPFFTTKPAGKGTGLGLAITNEIVSHHQGRFTIAARTDARGTEARIELPGARARSPDGA